jgi:hypothetical protein
MKSGTTFIQRRLKANSEDLSEHGVLVPGAWGASVVAATRDVMGLSSPHGAETIVGRWDELRSQLGQWPGRAAVVSMEFFSTSDEEQAKRAIDTLRPAPVEVLITARDLVRVIPSSWQESTQNGAVWTYEDYVDSIVADDGQRPGSKFWRQQDLVRIINTWASAAGIDHVHLVTVPQSGGNPDDLWHRFCQAIGVPGEAFTKDIPDVRANFALGHPSAEFMRRFNSELRSSNVTKAEYLQYAKRLIAKKSLNQRKQEAKVVLPAKYLDWASERAKRMRDDVAATGVHVIGDLDDLLPSPRDPSIDVHSVSEDEVVEAAVETIAVLLLELTKKYEHGSISED